MYTPVNPSFMKMGFRGVKIIQECFRDVCPGSLLQLATGIQTKYSLSLCQSGRSPGMVVIK